MTFIIMKKMISIIFLCSYIYSAETVFDSSSIDFDAASGFLVRGLHREAAEQFTLFLQKYPQDARISEAVYRRGEAYFYMKDYRSAAKDFYTYVAQYPTGQFAEIARLRYGSCFLELKYYKEAVQILEPIVNSNSVSLSTKETAVYYTGRAKHLAGDSKSALDMLAFAASNDVRPLALLLRAEIYLELLNPHDAIPILETFRKEFHNHELIRPALLQLADAYRLASRFDEAEQLLKPISVDHNDIANAMRARLSLGWVRVAMGDLSTAEALVKQVLTSTDSEIKDSANFLYGSIKFRQEDYQQAVTFLSQVVGSKQHEAQRQRAWAYYRAGNMAQALQDLGSLLKINNDSELNHLTGQCLLAIQKPLEAANYFKQSADAGGAYSTESAWLYAVALDAAKDFRGAINAYASFVERYSDHELVPYSLAAQCVLLCAEEQWEAALPIYARLLALTDIPVSLRESALRQQAVCYHRLGHFVNMSTVYKSLIKEFPLSESVPDALFLLAWVESSNKNRQQAIDYYRQLLQQFPNHILAGQARHKLAVELFEQDEKEESAKQLYILVTDQSAGLVAPQEYLWLAGHYASTARFSQADEIYQKLLNQTISDEMRITALRLQAESRMKNKAFSDAEATLQHLILLIDRQQSVNFAIRNDAVLRRAMCRRNQGRFAEANDDLNSLKLSSQDPLIPHYLYERGMLHAALGNWNDARTELMKFALLFDSEPLAGEALWTAAESCERMNDFALAKSCYELLAGVVPDSYGRLYPNSEWTLKARKKLGLGVE